MSNNAKSPTSSGAAPCSADLEMAALLVRWKDRILARAATNIEGHFLNSPVEDFSAEEEGFERGLRTAVDEVCKLMADPSYFGRSPQNSVVSANSVCSLTPDTARKDNRL